MMLRNSGVTIIVSGNDADRMLKLGWQKVEEPKEEKPKAKTDNSEKPK